MIIGAGLAGLTTAYELQQRGFRTVLVDAQSDVAQVSSHANGSMLTAALCQPWNAPGAAKQLIGSLLAPGSGIAIRPSAFPHIVPWGIQFIRNSSEKHYWYAVGANAQLAVYSIQCLRELTSKLGLSYAHSRSGNIQIFRDATHFDQAAAEAQRLRALGLTLHVMTPKEALDLEPELAPILGSIRGAIHAPDDEVGDAYLFCQQLAQAYMRAGGTLHLGQTVSGLLLDRSELRGIQIGGTTVLCKKAVIAAGVSSGKLLRQVNFSLPVVPVKGYTLTYDRPTQTPPLRMPIIDAALHAAVVPVGNCVRVAAVAEFAGQRTQMDASRLIQLRDILTQVCPRLAAAIQDQAGQPWSNLRPVSADGMPFIGDTGIHGLFVNAGHGHLGWTFAAGSARLLADIVCNKQTDIDSAPYRPTRNV